MFHIHRFKVILHNIFSALHFDLTCRARSGMEFSMWHHVSSKNVSDFGACQTSDFQIRNAQPVLPKNC
jgi:hypothetical protein